MSRTFVHPSLIILSVALAACTDVMDGTATAVTKGNVLAGQEAVLKRGCNACHTSSAGTLAGAVRGQGSAANLTPDEKTGLGGWKDEAIVSAIRDGIDDEQNTLCSTMPRALDLTDDEAANIVAYLRTLKPVSNAVTAPTCTPTLTDVAHHGKVVVEAQHCAACHGDKLSGSDGDGASMVFASNITSDVETGIGAWSASQIVAAVTTGVDDEDGALCSQMPRFANFTDDEAAGVAAYLATVPPVRHKVPASVCGSEQPDPLVEGKAYVTNRHCAACHKANLGGRPSCKAGEPANLTSTGLGGWSEKQIITAIRTGVDDEGKMLGSDMPRFATMGDDEAKAIVTYLRSVPAVVRPGCAVDGAGADGGLAEVRDAGALDAGPSDAGVSPVTEGKGYVTNRECQGCHEETLSGSPTCQQGEPANLTSTGLGKWSDQQIITAVRTGVDDQGTMLSTDMPRFSTMSDHEVTSIVAFLRSLPAVVRPGCERDGADAGVHQGSDGGVARADAGTPRLDAGVPGGCTTNSVVISQVYGGGGNIGARFNADYIELHNRSSHAVELGGWAIQYSSAAGTSWKSQLATIPSPTRLKAGTYVLLAIGPTGVKGASLPVTAVKLSKQVDMSATNGKVALTMDSVALEGDCPIGPSVADFVGYGTASCSEGGSAASPLSSALAAGRLLEAGAEMACVDTDTNASDFSKIAPQPHGSAKNICSCPK